VPTPSDVVAEHVRAVRRRRGLTAAQLAQRCAELGVPELTEQALYNIETGRPDKEGRRRRDVSVDELLVLAAALDIAPEYLVVPFDDEMPYQVTPTVTAPAEYVRKWVQGDHGLPGVTDWYLYAVEVPKSEWAKMMDGYKAMQRLALRDPEFATEEEIGGFIERLKQARQQGRSDE
jgi:transcriptional regulator with XRE-family HTH domain